MIQSRGTAASGLNSANNADSANKLCQKCGILQIYDQKVGVLAAGWGDGGCIWEKRLGYRKPFDVKLIKKEAS